MTCGNCVAHVEKALNATPGVHAVKVDLAANSATVRFDPLQTSEAALHAAIKAAGYEVGPSSVPKPTLVGIHGIAPAKPAPPSALTLHVQGMTCAACVGHVEKALKQVDGVSTAAVNLLANEARVTFNPAKTNENALKQAIKAAGYDVPAPPSALTIHVQGMTCAACVGHVEKALKQVDGVSTAAVNLLANEARVTFNPAKTNENALKQAIKAAGYDVPAPPSALTIHVQGMTCAACVGHVEKALRQVDGVSTAAVNLLANEARVTFNPAKTNEAALKQAIEQAGYKAEAPLNSEPDEFLSVRRHALISLVLGAIAMAAMPFTGHDSLFSRYAQLAAAVFVMAGPGRQYYLRAANGVPHLRFDMSTLIAVGTGAAFLYSLAATLAPHWFHSSGVMPDVYFEAVIFIIALVLTGRMFEIRARRETAASLRQLAELQPRTATILVNGEPVETAIEQVQMGDIALLKPGARIPIDGIVESGESAVDESMLTGEPIPVTKQPGDRLSAGTINGLGALHCKVTATVDGTALAQIGRMMRDAQSTRAPMQKLADQVSAIFVPVVLAIAALTLAGWLAHGASTGRALSAAVAVLIIACPCAMGLAIPAAVMVATGRAASLGVLIKGGEALERLSHIQTVVLDKTGTITEGRPAVTRYTGSPEDLPLIAALEAASEHPLANAIVRYANAALPPISDFLATPGQGAQGTVNGHTVKVGRPNWLGLTGDAAVAATIDGRFAGAFHVEDPIKSTSRRAIQIFQSAGLQVAMLTGDRESSANKIAKQLGITDVTADVLPAGKLDVIRAHQSNGRKVAMVGDGINDAPALAQADAGIAMASGAGIAVEAADVTLLRNDLTAVAAALRLSKLTVRIMRQNLFWAFCYNAAGIPIAALGLLNPVLASAAMALSSISVLANSLRLRRFQ
ncbi:MAG: cadmium-translocating P-type ATPase [Bryobacterales bacterium]|nr:cadmium-translocating P-type ATPase [Bryobacterales bacterium]